PGAFQSRGVRSGVTGRRDDCVGLGREGPGVFEAVAGRGHDGQRSEREETGRADHFSSRAERPSRLNRNRAARDSREDPVMSRDILSKSPPASWKSARNAARSSSLRKRATDAARGRGRTSRSAPAWPARAPVSSPKTIRGSMEKTARPRRSIDGGSPP